MMMRTNFFRGVAILPLLACGAALADPPRAQPNPGSDCRVAASPPPGFAAWARPVRLAAARNAASQPSLVLGQAADVSLLPVAGLAFAVRPGKQGEPIGLGGLIGLEVREAGTYRIALGSGAWIDVVRGGAVVASTGHGHGPDCSGLRKIVDFTLTPGRYTVQLSSASAAQMRVLAIRAR